MTRLKAPGLMHKSGFTKRKLTMGRLRWISLVWIAVIHGQILFAADNAQERILTARDLYAGLEATRVIPKGDSLVLDARNLQKTGGAGVIITDVLDLIGTGILSNEGSISDLGIQITANAEAPAHIAVEVRTGTSFFQTEATWSKWQPAIGAIIPRGRYAQFRFVLTTTDARVLPAITGAKITYQANPSVFPEAVILLEDQVQQILVSPVVFGYERPDQSDLTWLRQTFKLDEVIAGKQNEFGQLKALLDWVAKRKNKRPEMQNPDGSYPWNIRKALGEENGGTIYGHCMSYCETLISAVISLGWQARHLAIKGFRDTNHEVAEIWVNELNKWVYLDPSLDTYYADRKTGQPLSLLEMHNIYTNFVLKPGEIQRRGEDVNLSRVEALRGKHPIKCVTNDYTYGEHEKWDWEYGHGYLTAGWMQLTPRNNWQSQPEPWCRAFAEDPDGYCGFPVYIDEKTPIVESSTAVWYTRPRDLWWSLNQASFRLIRTGDDTLSVECGNSQPFFKRYLARIDGGEWKPVDSHFQWKLGIGRNQLEINVEDEFGRKGIVSKASVRLGAR